jgi:general secretion pathway protein E
VHAFYKPPEPAAAPDGAAEVCEHCNGAGYVGRVGIFEFLVVTEGVRQALRGQTGIDAVRTEAAKAGLRPLQDDGLRQVVEGKTSVQELLRVCK